VRLKHTPLANFSVPTEQADMPELFSPDRWHLKLFVPPIVFKLLETSGTWKTAFEAKGWQDASK